MINYQLLFDAECERFIALRNEIKKQDTEIERFKAVIQTQDDAARSTEAFIENLRGLITELSDALDYDSKVYEADYGLPSWAALRKKAREVVRK
jgi:hypothetical protein